MNFFAVTTATAAFSGEAHPGNRSIFMCVCQPRDKQMLAIDCGGGGGGGGGGGSGGGGGGGGITSKQ